jgi:hypothetical protein
LLKGRKSPPRGGRLTGYGDRSATPLLPMIAVRSTTAGAFTAGASQGGGGWPEAATSGQSALMCSCVFATLGRRHHAIFAMPNDKALIVNRQKVELEAKPFPAVVALPQSDQP